MIASRYLFSGTLAAIVGFSATTLCAQQPSSAFEPMPPPATQSTVKESPDDTTDENELGEVLFLRSPARPKLFKVSSDTQYLFTSNILLLPNLKPQLKAEQDSLLLQTFGLSFSPQLLDKLTSTVFLRQQMAQYSAHDEDDFDAQTAGLQLSYPVKDWFDCYAGFSAGRMVLQKHDDEFYKAYDAQFGLWRTQPLCSRASVFFGYQYDWVPASPSELSRADNSLYVGANAALLKKLNAQLLYRLSFQDYNHFSGEHRSDRNQLVTFALNYAFNDYVSIHAFTDYGHNDSNFKSRTYGIFDAGGGLNLSLRF